MLIILLVHTGTLVWQRLCSHLGNTWPSLGITMQYSLDNAAAKIGTVLSEDQNSVCSYLVQTVTSPGLYCATSCNRLICKVRHNFLIVGLQINILQTMMFHSADGTGTRCGTSCSTLAHTVLHRHPILLALIWHAENMKLMIYTLGLHSALLNALFYRRGWLRKHSNLHRNQKICSTPRVNTSKHHLTHAHMYSLHSY
jgi:hypothetical protein